MSEVSDSDLPDLVDPSLALLSATSPSSPSLPSPSPSPTPALAPLPLYDFENEPKEVWDSYSVSPSRRRAQPNPSPVELNFLRHWTSREDRGSGFPPRAVGMQVKWSTIQLEIELPKTFKHACSTSPGAYRDFWLALRASSAFEQLSTQQKDVIRGTLASAHFFCDDSLSTRRHWPSYRESLLEISQFAGEDGLPGEVLLGWLLGCAKEYFPEALNTHQWD